jgi:penicillin-binding protein 2
MDQNTSRRFALGLIVVVIGLIFLVKLFSLQVINTDYKSTAQRNISKRVVQYPARGLIYDRNGKLFVYNQPAYDLMVTPQLVKPFDTTEFIGILEITQDDLKRRMAIAQQTPYVSSIFLKQISAHTYAILQEKLYKYPGFFVQNRTLRKYSKNIAAHVLGYVGEVDQRIVDENEYYEMGDHIGINGLESAYEEHLRGQKGEKILLVDVHNRIQGPYQQGRYDKDPKVGTNITTTLDMVLQEYGEQLMVNKRGSIVAIEPATGEVLALISSPTYDPELLVGRNRSVNFAMLKKDTLDPLFNRAIMSYFRPGSTFKLVAGAIALQENILAPHTLYNTAGAYRAGRVVVGCHNNRSPLNVMQAIQYSSNNFFCQLFRNTVDNKKYDGFYDAYNVWRDHVMSFGYGSRMGIELPNEKAGLIPPTSYYDRYYGANGWRSLTVISLAIGEGELGVTPLQLANNGAVFANRGFYHKPHLIKKIGNNDMQDEFAERKYVSIDSVHLETVIDGMELVVNGGPGSTAGWCRLKDIVICGKTGTAENKDKEDHSVFVAFAPRENPQIAISVYIEYGGSGGSWAAPVASLMIEKYLTGTVNRRWFEERILNANLLSVEKKD